MTSAVLGFPPASALGQTVSTGGRQIRQLLADPLRPVVYGLNDGAGGNASLIAFNATNGILERETVLAANPHAMAASPIEGALYVIHFGSDQIVRVNLDSMAIDATRAFVAPGNWQGSAEVRYRLYVRAPGELIYTDGQWAPMAHLFEFARGVGSYAFSVGDFGVGGLAVGRDGRTAYAWGQYGWSAGIAVSQLARLELAESGARWMAASPQNLGRDPLDTPVLLTLNEDRVFIKDRVFRTDDLEQPTQTFAENIYAISLHGELAVGTSRVFDGRSGAVLANLPAHSTVSAFTGDQRTLFIFDPEHAMLRLVPVAPIATVADGTLVPTPSDGAWVASNLVRLTWTHAPVAAWYDVYLGMDAAEVAVAGPGSPLHLTRTLRNEVLLTNAPSVGQRHHWRVDAGTPVSVGKGAVWSFDVAPIAVDPAGIRVGAIVGHSPRAVMTTIRAPADLSWNVEADESWLGVEPQEGRGSGVLRLALDTGSLPAGVHTNGIRIRAGEAVLKADVVVDVQPLRLSRLVADLSRPYLYGLQAPSAGDPRHSIVILHAETERIEHLIPVGRNPTDMTLHYGEDRLYVTDWGGPQAHFIELGSPDVARTLPMDPDAYRINAGRPGRLIVEGYDQWVQGYLWDTTTGARVTDLPWPIRAGDGESSPDGRHYYHADHDISNARIHKYEIADDIPRAVGTSVERPSGSRNLVMSPDGSRLFWKGYVYDSDLSEIRQLGEEIHGASLRGELAFSSRRAYNVANGEAVFQLPFETSVLAVSGAQDKLFLYNPATERLVVVPTRDIAPIPDGGLIPLPADGATVNVPLTRLAWSMSPPALSYRVYLGMEAAAVASATPDSEEYLGSTNVPAMTLVAPLDRGRTYSWRVDQVAFAGERRGAVWSFDTAPFRAGPQAISIRALTGAPIPQATVVIDMPDATMEWRLSVSVPWMEASREAGTGTEVVTLRVDPSGIRPGTMTAEVRITGGGSTVVVPVTLEVVALRLTQLVADRERPRVYGLHPGTAGEDDAYLVVIDTVSERIERVVPAGANPTDLSIGYAENRLYVADWQRDGVRVFDLETWAELASLPLGPDVYRVNAGPAGRLVVEGHDQWVRMRLVDTAGGHVLGDIMVREGDGEYSPDLKFYYHGDNNSSGATIRKFRIEGDAFEPVATSINIGFGSRNLVMSEYGSRIFWVGGMFDAELAYLGAIGGEVYAATADGGYAFGSNQVWDTEGRSVAYRLPFASTVQAVATSVGKLFAFDPASARVVAVGLGVITNRAPVASNLVITTEEDVPVPIELRAVDPEGDPIEFQVLSEPRHGVLSGTGAGRLYSPGLDFHGVDSFTYVARDAHRTSAVATVTVVVTPVNDAPVAYGREAFVPAGGERLIVLAGSDVEGTPLTYRIEEAPAHGTLRGVPPEVVYVATPGFEGTDSFSYTVSDGELRSSPAIVALRIETPECRALDGALAALWSGEGQPFDRVGGMDAEPFGDVTYAPGRSGQGFRLGSDGGFLRIPPHARLSLGAMGAGFTVDAWLRVEGDPGTRILLGWGTNDTPAVLKRLVRFQGGMAIEAVFRSSAGQVSSIRSPGFEWGEGFHHVALAFDAPSGIATLYRNGTVAAVGSVGFALPARVEPIHLGGWPGALTGYQGVLDEVAIHSRPLPAEEVRAIFDADHAGRCLEARFPVILVPPQPVQVGVGASVQFSVEAAGSGPLEYQWRRDGVVLPGAVHARLELAGVREGDAGLYTVVVRNALGEATSEPVALRVALVANGGFEEGGLEGWILDELSDPVRAATVGPAGRTVWSSFFRTQPAEGTRSLMHGWDAGVAGVLRLSQPIAVPAAGAVLSFRYRAAWDLQSFGTSSYPRVFRVAVLGVPEANLLLSQNILVALPNTVVNDTGWQVGTLDLGDFAGTAVMLRFEWTVPEPLIGPGQFELDDVRVVPGAMRPSLAVTNLHHRADGEVRITYREAVGERWRVQVSSDLRTWQVLGEGDRDGSGRVEVGDPGAIGEAFRFYRLVGE
ncbi:MAG: immunoglobulin domain-containing protein [Verrucomicrobiae bacterium]|nr:immunoglobulin domain-containing protein [Verrucomicrobiae bacterium]